MSELRGLFTQIQSNKKSIDFVFIMQKSFIAKKLDIKDESSFDDSWVIYTSVASCFAIKEITKNMALF